MVRVNYSGVRYNREYLLALRKKRRIFRLCLVAALYVAVVLCGLIGSIHFGNADSVEMYNQYSNNGDGQTRHKRDLHVYIEEEEKNCTPRSIENFPGNFMSLQDTKDGGVFIHILFAIYLFGALAIVCDDYFVPSCEHICTGLNLQEDVAGATFMAAGSSTPEFFTSVVGVFIAQSDVGVGTIVGSAVFNILFIIAICGIFAGMVVELTWWPMFRDLVFYLISVVSLIVVIQDGLVHWYEALVMFVLYIVYIIIMFFNPRLEKKALEVVTSIKHRTDEVISVDEDRQHLLSDTETPSYSDLLSSRSQETKFGADIVEDDIRKVGQLNEEKDEDYESPWTIPENFLGRIYWVSMVPVKAILYVTVPDCRRPGIWHKLFLLTFLISILWIAAFSYLMVWMVTIAGDALEIPDTVMGLTILAAGTSVPDCLSSLLVARDGLGDMAVSNSIGSNIFDILMCLGFPWLLETVIVNTGEQVEINSAGLTYSSIILLSTVAFLLISTVVNKWKIDRRLGIIFLVVYVIVIALACLFELNIFGDFNKPACSR